MRRPAWAGMTALSYAASRMRGNDGGPSADREPLLRLGAGVRARVLGDQVFERAARAGVVAELGLRRGDVEHRVGNLGAVGKLLDQRALRGDRALEVAARELRVADPVLRGCGERRLRVLPDERAEARDRAGVVGALELVERGVVCLLLGRRRRQC